MMQEDRGMTTQLTGNPQDESESGINRQPQHHAGDRPQAAVDHEASEGVSSIHMQGDDLDGTGEETLMIPLMAPRDDGSISVTTAASSATTPTDNSAGLKSRTANNASRRSPSSRRRRNDQKKGDNRVGHRSQRTERFKSKFSICGMGSNSKCNVTNVLARLVFWVSVVATTAAVFWYSYELQNNGTDPHLIAWFSAGAFVLLGFPISMYGIVMHLANYNQPNVQIYIVRILWMVPIYSMESWLCLRFHHLAVYIETLRDCYESYVLYSFLQFLIQVLGGEEALIQLLKDKSPTRGVHMWGLQWCVRPWLMGQPVSRSVYQSSATGRRLVKRVQWTSPFFVRCKFGVLQYVLLKFVLSVFVMILELSGLYKEGDFTPRGGYLYICILTNISQCWALYCLIFFYYATKNELSPIRPVGKFLSVKAIVFFTWWQSVCVSFIYQMDMIPHYHAGESPANEWTSEDVAKGLQDYLICIEMFVAALVHTFVFPHTDYLPAAVMARQRTSVLRSSSRKIRLGRRHNKTSPYGWLYVTERDDSSKNSNTIGFSDDRTIDDSYTTNGGGGIGETVGDLELASHGASSEGEESSPIHLLQPHHSPKRSPKPLSGKQQSRTTMPVPEEGDVYELHEGTSSVIEDELEENDSEFLLVDDYGDDDDDDDVDDGDGDGDEDADEIDDVVAPPPPVKTGFVRALLESAIPKDVIDNSVGIVKGDYVVEKKTLLHHAATSDQYDIFASRSLKRNSPSTPSKKTDKEQQ